MAKKRLTAKQKKAAKKLKFKAEEAEILKFRRKAPYVRQLLRIRGIEPKFLDYLDSYRDEFHLIIQDAKSRYPTLLDVHIVEDHVFDNLRQHWAAFGYSALTQIFFKIDNGEDYNEGRHMRSPANKNEGCISGCTVAFKDPGGNLKTAVFIPQKVRTPNYEHTEYKFSARILALCHEIGHVDDLENDRFFDVEAETFDVISGEVHANIFGLNMLADRGLKQGYETLLESLVNYASNDSDDSICVIAQQVIDAIKPREDLFEWSSQLSDLTPEELSQLGAEALAVIGE